jgi:hypothetical protein
MRFDGNLFPNPVLGRSNDVAGKYEPLPPIVDISSEININIKHQLFCDSIQSEIKEGNANYCVEIHCLNTFYRKTFHSFDEDQKVKVSSHDLRGNIELNFLIIASTDFKYPYSKSWHPDYESMEFHLSKGMPLAYGGSSNFEVEDQFDGLQKGSNFIHIIQDDSQLTGPFEVSLTGDPLIISLPKKEFQMYHSLHQRPDYCRHFHSAIAVPAISYAISIMGSQSGDVFSDRKWYQAIKAKMESDQDLRSLEINETDSLKAAQLILQNPLNEMLHNIKTEISTSEEEQ